MSQFSHFLNILDNSDNHALIEAIRAGYQVVYEATNDVKYAMNGVAILDEIKNILIYLFNEGYIADIISNPVERSYTFPLSNGAKLTVCGENNANLVYLAGYTVEKNEFVIYLVSMLKAAGYQIKPDMEPMELVKIFDDFFKKQFDKTWPFVKQSLCEYLVHEMRHKQDAEVTKKYGQLNIDMAEYNKEVNDYDMMQANGNGGMTSKNNIKINETVKKILTEMNLLPNFTSIQKQCAEHGLGRIYTDLFGDNPYRRPYLNGIKERLEKMRNSITPADWRNIIIDNYLKTPAAANDPYFANGLVGSQTRNEVIGSRMAVEWVKQLYTMRVYINTMTEINAHITQFVPQIAMLRPSNGAHFSVKQMLQHYLYKMGNMYGDEAIPGPKRPNETDAQFYARQGRVAQTQQVFMQDNRKRIIKRLYTLLNAANRITIEPNDTLETRLTKILALMKRDKEQIAKMISIYYI